MRYLCQGQEDARKIDLLLSLTRISESMSYAIHDHLVKNFTVSNAAMLNSVQQSHLTSNLTKLNAIAETVEKVNELIYTG